MLKQFRNHSLSIISLVVALSALGYNTWRNEQTEHNRNIRAAGFEMLLHLGELQRITYLAHYDRDQQQGNPRNGWVKIMVLKDLGALMPDSLHPPASQLTTAWTTHWEGLGKEDVAIEQIETGINQLRDEVLASLKKLD